MSATQQIDSDRDDRDRALDPVMAEFGDIHIGEPNARGTRRIVVTDPHREADRGRAWDLTAQCVLIPVDA